MGSPPRMRGKGSRACGIGGADGITPAYAGKRPKAAQHLTTSRDHPRVCGEKKSKRIAPSSVLGSPPRMRGKAVLKDIKKAAAGITPAYAGKSVPALAFFRVLWDHPRVCGEKYTRSKSAYNSAGITPAYAGKRPQLERSPPLAQDHPRVCGEKYGESRGTDRKQGSPPRMRGKVSQQSVSTIQQGITPAYAGKREIVKVNECVVQDHPRVCGEKTKKIP